MVHTRTGATFALAALLLCAPAAWGTSTSVPHESWGRRLTPHSATLTPIPAAATTRLGITLRATGRLAFLDVRVDVQHPRPDHLQLSLISPSGTRVVLARDVRTLSGTFGVGLTSLEALEQLEGEEPWGTWELEIQDRASGAPGVLRSWGLDLQLQSRGTHTANAIRTPYETYRPRVGGLRRRVFYSVPDGTPPPGGWPVAFLFHGAGATSQTFFRGYTWYPYNAWHQARLVKGLLDAGYLILAPEAKHYGTIWETSLPRWANDYEHSADHALMQHLFAELRQGRFGFVDTTRYYAGGISSGGYMSSRMAVSYPGRFRALAIHGGAFATNLGPLASLPPRLPAQHPPTVFLHGERDWIVPPPTMRAYRDALLREGVQVRTVIDPDKGHVWLDQAPEEFLAWFEGH